jgi:hypothetical protein
VGFVVEKVALEHVFSEYFGFPLPIFIPPISPQSPSPIIRGWYNRPVVAAIPKVPPHKLQNKTKQQQKKNKKKLHAARTRVRFPMRSLNFFFN